jgi:hypothetical protein
MSHRMRDHSASAPSFDLLVDLEVVVRTHLTTFLISKDAK